MYKFTDNNSVIRISDGAYIPFAEGNRDYQEYKEWLALGNTPQPAHTDEELLEIAKAKKLTLAGIEFAKRRDAIRWIDGYGYDCASDDIVNFFAVYTPLLVVGTGSGEYKVWTSETTKGTVILTLAQLTTVYDTVRTSQLEAYHWYEGIRTTIKACTTQAELDAIVWPA